MKVDDLSECYVTGFEIVKHESMGISKLNEILNKNGRYVNSKAF